MFSKDYSIDIDYSILLKNKVPLLVQDNTWKQLFRNVNDKNLITCKEQLESLLKEQEFTNKDLRALKIKKKKLMDKILEISHQANSEKKNERLDILQECKQRLLEMNDELDELTFKTETLPKKIREANFQLLKATIKYAYKELRTKQKNLTSVTQEIESLKNELRGLIEQKHDYEESINLTYKFLHGILGSKEMERLDNNLL
ncbi:hypothetical protein [Caldisalinibacter kiritimatiensis]|uniref:Exonuclease SbcC n=1 Tax=Caldisalinibacter kiritimatiensis TaxID=1304284 RepID=R1CS59_9FIRM|nr:hypothetical protein [Caldisalinibacter kiritimatiensis]EOC99528.1 hypothetical protein L21TH_2440 [Caldisalinibacter kiritimatiensis]